MAVSNFLCNKLVDDFIWFLVVKHSAGTIVKFALDTFELANGDSGKVGVGEVLPL